MQNFLGNGHLVGQRVTVGQSGTVQPFHSSLVSRFLLEANLRSFSLKRVFCLFVSHFVINYFEDTFILKAIFYDPMSSKVIDFSNGFLFSLLSNHSRCLQAANSIPAL